MSLVVEEGCCACTCKKLEVLAAPFRYINEPTKEEGEVDMGEGEESHERFILPSLRKLFFAKKSRFPNKILRTLPRLLPALELYANRQFNHRHEHEYGEHGEEHGDILDLRFLDEFPSLQHANKFCIDVSHFLHGQCPESGLPARIAASPSIKSSSSVVL